MSILSVTDGVGFTDRLFLAVGGRLVKEAGTPEPAFNLRGTLYLSDRGWILLTVPNAMVRGMFQAMHEPGTELPFDKDGGLNAHISVFRPEELESLGGPDHVTERGKTFTYTVGRVYSVEPGGWAEMSKVWYLKVHSPELQTLRRSYGLSPLPNDGKYDFHITVAVRKKHVLHTNEVRKGLSGQSA